MTRYIRFMLHVEVEQIVLFIHTSATISHSGRRRFFLVKCLTLQSHKSSCYRKINNKTLDSADLFTWFFLIKMYCFARMKICTCTSNIMHLSYIAGKHFLFPISICMTCPWPIRMVYWFNAHLRTKVLHRFLLFVFHANYNWYAC